MMLKNIRIFLLVFFIMILCSPLLLAETYNAADDFSATTNPNNVWTYGYQDSLGVSFTLYDKKTTSSGLSIWYAGVTNISGYADIDPVIVHNGTSSTINSGAGVSWAPNQLSLHPGVVTPPYEIYNVHPYSVLRWTAPSDGYYTINASFMGLDSHDATGTTTDVHVLLNGTSLFNEFVLGFGNSSEETFFSSILLVNGDTLDFAVGPALTQPPYYDYQFDTTGVDVAISTVPEPTTMLLLSLGLFGLAGMRRKMQR